MSGCFQQIPSVYIRYTVFIIVIYMGCIWVYILVLVNIVSHSNDNGSSLNITVFQNTEKLIETWKQD